MGAYEGLVIQAGSPGLMPSPRAAPSRMLTSGGRDDRTSGSEPREAPEMDGGLSHAQPWPRHVTGPWPKLPPRTIAAGPPLPADAIPYEVGAAAAGLLSAPGFRQAVDAERRARGGRVRRWLRAV